MKEKGFTLMELVLTLAIGAIISTVAVISIFNLMDTSTRTQDVNKVMSDLDVAALQIRKDAFVLQDTNLSENITKTLNQASPGANISISWTDYSGYDDPDARTHNIYYTLSDGLLRRVDTSANGTTTVVGRYITEFSITKSGRFLDIVITATSDTFPNVVRTLSFQTYTRSVGVE